jgi:hypothetical protein
MARGAERTFGWLQAGVDPKPRIDELKTSGDKVSIALGGGAKLAAMILPAVRAPIGVRLEGNYDVRLPRSLQRPMARRRVTRLSSESSSSVP